MGTGDVGVGCPALGGPPLLGPLPGLVDSGSDRAGRLWFVYCGHRGDGAHSDPQVHSVHQGAGEAGYVTASGRWGTGTVRVPRWGARAGVGREHQLEPRWVGHHSVPAAETDLALFQGFPQGVQSVWRELAGLVVQLSM